MKGRRGRPLIFGQSLEGVAADQALEGLADWLDGFEGEVAAAVPAVADGLRAEQDATIAAGADAYGRAWEPRKDGGAPLRNASRAVRFSVVASTIAITLEGIEVAHHLGFARGYKGGTKLRRPVIPEKRGGLPAKWQERIRAELREFLGLR